MMFMYICVKCAGGVTCWDKMRFQVNFQSQGFKLILVNWSLNKREKFISKVK